MWYLAHSLTPGDSYKPCERFPWMQGFCTVLPGVVKPYPQISSFLSCLKSVSRSWGTTHKSSFKFLINSFLLSSLLFFFFFCCVSMNNLTNQFTGRDVSRQGNFKSVLHSTCRKCISNMLLRVSSLELKTGSCLHPKSFSSCKEKIDSKNCYMSFFLIIILVIGAAVLVHTTGLYTIECCLLQQPWEEIQGNFWMEQLLSQRRVCYNINPLATLLLLPIWQECVQIFR